MARSKRRIRTTSASKTFSAVPIMVESFINGKMIVLPKQLQQRLVAADTPKQIEKAIADNESKVAELTRGKGERYVNCDVCADIMSQVLRLKGIPHEVVLGKSDEGSSHVWVRIGDKDFDSTHQGFGNGRFSIIDKYKSSSHKLVGSLRKRVGSF